MHLLITKMLAKHKAWLTYVLLATILCFSIILSHSNPPQAAPSAGKQTLIMITSPDYEYYDSELPTQT